MALCICDACVFFKPEMKTAVEVIRKHCACEPLDELFGSSVGFPSGCRIFNCDFFRPAQHLCSDVTYQFPDGKRVSFIVPSRRPKSRSGAGDLYDNSKNQTIRKMLNYSSRKKV